MRLLLRSSVVLGCSFAVAGCTLDEDDDYDLRGTVRDASTGKPVAGATIELVDVETTRIITYDGNPSRSDVGGEFRIEFGVKSGDSRSSREWKAKISAEGYGDEIFKIGPVVQPESGDPVHIVLHVYLRAAKPEKDEKD